MRSGLYPLEGALGGRLLHTLRLGPGFVLRKGTVLQREDLDRLRAAGHREVAVTFLDDGDVEENEAARRIGAALGGEGLRLSSPAQGRINLHATRAGLLRVDPERVAEINLVSEAVTLATLGPDARVDPGDLVATLKTVPLAVPGPVLARCIAAAGSPSVIALAAFRPFTAALLLTRDGYASENALDRAAAVQRARLAQLGGTVLVERRCDHRPEPFRAGLDELLAHQPDLVLLLGAQGAADRSDLVPRLLVEAGGTVERLGVPLDPGNLLLWGRLGQTAVVGVPACSRTPRENGLDWILERWAAGMPLDASALARAGCGGLFPPRRDRAGCVSVAAVVLAAGRSSRMGPRNKLLQPVCGLPMIARVVDTALASRVARVVVVTGHDASAVTQALAGRPVEVVHNPRFAEGMSTSLQVGLEPVREHDGALVLLGDMPWIAPATLDALIDAFRPEGGASLCVPTYGPRRGNPVLWGAQHFEAIAGLRGDEGARRLLERFAEVRRNVPVDDEGILRDVDAPEDLGCDGARE